MIELGSIHGRFQPFHNAHLEYAKQALDRSERIYIGLTRTLPDIGPIDQSAPHRLKEESNPFTYFQRAAIISAAMASAGFSSERFSVGPFPIEKPELLEQYWPNGLPCFTTIVDGWNSRKRELLTGLGYEVVVLNHGGWAGEQYRSGTEIRRLIRVGDPSWQDYVPSGAADVIRQYCEGP
jgi:nicotinamide mononucleotide adenylyltransferase